MKLVECAPSFSEGRRPEVVEAICAEIAAVPGVNLIGSEMDVVHNRAVVTFVGGLDSAVEAAFVAIRKAAELIDPREHEGAHPRMGATDVCPFIPLGETTEEEAADCARALGARVGEELGFHLEDRDLAQVSMNLTDYRKTSPGAAFEEILESRLAPPNPLDACTPFLDVLASGSPTPGGGSAAALGGAAAAALAGMVAGVTIGKKKYAEVEDEMRSVQTRAEGLRAELSALIRKDAGAYDGLMAAMRLPKETDADKAARREAMGAAAVAAAEVPVEVMRAAVGVMELARVVVEKGNRNAASDGAVAALFARAAIRAGDMNVRINLASVKDEALRERFAGEAGEIAARAEELERLALSATGL